MINYNKHEQADIFLTSIQAAKLLNLSLSTLKKLIYQGKIKTLKTPGGHYRIRKSELLLLNGSEVKAAPDLDNTKETLGILQSLIADLEKKHKFGHGHSWSVAALSEKIARKLGFSDEKIENLKLAAALHDIGMIDIDAGILNKTYPLSEKEYSIIKTHPLTGSQMANSLSQLKGASAIIKQHHEWFNGGGYPLGLKEDDICLEAKIIAVAEAFDCLTAKNSYQNFLPKKEAAKRIKRYSGRQFDPEVVEAFFKIGGSQ